MKRFLTSYLTLFFFGLIAVLAINYYNSSYKGELLGEIAPVFQTLFFNLVLSLWVRRDSMKLKTAFPTDLFLLFGGYLLPVYLIHSRSWKGCLFLVGLFILLVIFGIAVAIF